MSPGPPRRRDESMTLITEMMQHPLDPGYAAAAKRRVVSGLPAAKGVRSPLTLIAVILIGALLTSSALALRAPTTATNQIKQGLVTRINERRADADAQTALISNLQNQINVVQAAALNLQSQSALAAEISTLEVAAGTVPVTGPGLVLTVDDAPTAPQPIVPTNPANTTGVSPGTVLATDLQIIVNGLWEAGAEAISINGNRLTTRAAIRSAGIAILVDYRPLTRPYVITAIGDPASLAVNFAENSGGSYLQSLKSNYQIRGDIQNRTLLVVPGEPTLSLQVAQPLRSPTTSPTPTGHSTAARNTTPTPAHTIAPRTMETSP
jgi:uncharacterized protein YlxW (UPF0749 family)